MTYDSDINTTWGGFMADLRDKVSSMTNWGLTDTSANGDAAELANGEWFVLSMPTGENVRIGMGGIGIHGGNSNGALVWEYGPSWDTGSSSWSDTYSVASSSVEYDGISCRDSGANAVDSVTYHAYYADADGFAFYVDGSEGDGQDRDFMFGFAELTKLWDYSTAANREANYAIAYEGQNNDVNNQKSGGINYTGESASQRASSTRDAFGRTNPDANYDNFPVQKQNLVASDQYQGDTNSEAVIGTHDLWMTDESGSDSAHLDTVQDSGGTNIYTLVSAHLLSRGIKM